MQKLFVSQDVIQFPKYEEFDSQLAPNVLGYLAGLGYIMSCGLVRACEIAFSINLSVFSCAVVHTQLTLLISPNTLPLKFCSSCVIMLCVHILLPSVLTFICILTSS